MVSSAGYGPVDIEQEDFGTLVVNSAIPLYEGDYPGHQRLYSKLDRRAPRASPRLEAALDKLFEQFETPEDCPDIIQYIDVGLDSLIIEYFETPEIKKQLEQLAHEALD